MSSSATPKTTALVLSGGGARGAYEAGIVRYLREELPHTLGHQPKIDILCGTSVGAVTACFLAATMDHPETQGRELAAFWTSMSLEKVYNVQGQDLWSLTRKMWRAATNEPRRPEGWRINDILHPEFLEEMVRQGAPWERIQQNLNDGHLSAVSVSTTNIRSGRTEVFVQTSNGQVPAWSRDPTTLARPAIMGPEHALASAAIPLLFRSVKIGEEYYCDGGLRQNTPLSPALRLGAERVLIISLKHQQTFVEAPLPPLTEYPSTPMLMGKVLNALLLDRTDYDLDRLHRFNGLLDAGTEIYGKDFIAKMSEAIRTQRGQAYRMVEDMVLRPSRDIAVIASKHAKKNRVSPLPSISLPIKLLHRIAQSQLVTEADLASYLLFDGEYAQDLITLGMEDAHTQREALASFFSAA